MAMPEAAAAICVAARGGEDVTVHALIFGLCIIIVGLLLETPDEPHQ